MRLLQTAVLCLMAASLASATTMNYDISIVFNFGPLDGQTGSGTLSFDDSLIQHVGGFNFVAPNGLGLLSLQFTAAGHTIDMTEAVNYPTMPTLDLDASNIPTFLTLAWGSTTTTNAEAFLVGGGFDYYTVANSLTSDRIANGSTTQGSSFGPGNAQSAGTITFQQSGVPEPSTTILFLAGATLLGLWRFRNRTV